MKKDTQLLNFNEQLININFIAVVSVCLSKLESAQGVQTYAKSNVKISYFLLCEMDLPQN